MRTVLSAVVLAAAILIHVLTPGPAAATNAPVPILRDAVTVDAESITLGDLFANAGKQASTPIGEAPEPGRRMVLDATVLYRVAQSFGLAWQPTSRAQRIVVERAAVPVERATILGQVQAALDERGFNTDQLALDLTQPVQPILVPPAAVVKLVHFNHNAGNGRFEGVVDATLNGRTIARARIAGHVYRMAEVPVPNRRIRAGEVIDEADLIWVEVKDKRLAANAVTDADAIIGMAPRRTLRQGVVILASELTRPRLVEKGGLVTLVLATRSMQLTTRGRALEGGGEGDVIRVANLHSHTVVEGQIDANGRVLVGLSSAR